MSERRTIFDIYRSKDFSRNPSPDTWNRLEKRLDEKPIHGRLYFWNKFSIAATFLLLIGVAGMTTWVLRDQANAPRFASLYSPAQMVEDFNYMEDYDSYKNEYAVIREYRQAFQDIFDAMQPTDEAYADASEGSDDTAASSDMLSVKDNEPLAFRKHSLVETNQDLPEQKKIIQSDINKDFSWLKGHWKGTLEDVPYYTDWKMEDKQTMIGKGYMLQEDDTLFKEEIALKQIGQEVYLVRIFPDNDYAGQFEMTLAEADTEWIFSHQNQRVLLEREGRDFYQMQSLNFGENAHAEKEMRKAKMYRVE